MVTSESATDRPPCMSLALPIKVPLSSVPGCRKLSDRSDVVM